MGPVAVVQIVDVEQVVEAEEVLQSTAHGPLKRRLCLLQTVLLMLQAQK